jgi:hypothetical protein
MYISCCAKCSNLHKLCTVPGSGSRFRIQVPVPVSLYRCIAVSLFSSSRCWNIISFHIKTQTPVEYTLKLRLSIYKRKYVLIILYFCTYFSATTPPTTSVQNQFELLNDENGESGISLPELDSNEQTHTYVNSQIHEYRSKAQSKFETERTKLMCSRRKRRTMSMQRRPDPKNEKKLKKYW